MARHAGLEPASITLELWCFIQLDEWRINLKKGMANCHTLALDYDIDQLGNRSTATHNHTHLTCTVCFTCFQSSLGRDATP